ncbi:LytR/AlgR family response regulator transcription factor [Mariniflexile sp.]|uniref:LytR/AlgR family response regulator transcription factor n=1 Tax=Mariniflexile sp. TaxID=1979402 RepID=UPI0035633168
MTNERLINVLIVENEMISGQHMALQLKTLGYHVSGIMLQGEDALIHLKQNTPDLILLDINLNGELDGIETAKIIQQDYKIPIIYVTANCDDANFNKAKTTNPYGFISKPFKKQQLQRNIELSLNRFYSENNSTTTPTANEEDKLPFILSDCIFVRHQDKMVKVQINNILYIEAERNYSRIYSKNKEYLIVATLKDLNDKLPNHHFIRIHRSFIVNISQIDEISTSHIVISKKAIPISSESKKQLLQRIQKI